MSCVRATAAMAMLAVLCATSELRAEDPPNIILILADDQSWNGTSVRMDPDNPLSASDYYQTPNLEALASQGMRFSNAYSSASICSPTRAALQTGRSPAQLQMTDIVKPEGVRSFDSFPLKPPEWRRVDPSYETLADRVKAADSRYVTGHLGKWHIEPSNPGDMGYDIGFDIGSLPGAGTEDPAAVFGKTAAALDFLDDRVAAGDPFFLQLSHFAVHQPVEYQQSVLEKYQNLPKGSVHTNAEFAAFTEALDTAVGQLLDHVDSLGLSDNTYIIYASDNGARNVESNNYPLSGYKAHLMDGGIRTPLLIKGPGIDANSVSHIPVTTVDLYSTVSDLAGNTTPFTEGVEGASLVPLLTNAGELPDGMEFLERQYADNGAIFFSQPHNNAAGPNYRIRPMYAVRVGDYKLLRIQGENGDADRDYLFDFSSTLAETEDSGPQDISAMFPDKTVELSSMLDSWIQSTDASLAYDVAKPTEIFWTADQRGNDPDIWRAATDVDHLWRESFEAFTEAEKPTVVHSGTHFVNGPASAFSFDGGDILSRRFFHVGDPVNRANNTKYPTGVADFDHSVTFEMLVKPDDLNAEQMLFESGEVTNGLSISFGDDDNDGQYDEARFRLLTKSGDFLVVNADVDEYANPTRDFMLIAAIVSDNPTDRYIELFVNGNSVGRADGVPGDEMLLWDEYYRTFRGANLGKTPSAYQTGGNSGGGDLPFLGGGFRGQIASFRFLNYAISSSEVQASYATLLTEPSFQVSSTSGAASIASSRPSSIAAGEFELDSTLWVLHERVDSLDAELAVDAVATAGGTITVDGVASLETATLDAGTRYSSYLLHFDSEADTPSDEQLVGSITFNNPIVGLLVNEATLDATELLMGVAGEFDTQERSILNSGDAIFSISSDLKTLQFDMTLDASLLTQLRVLVLPDALLQGDYNGDGTVNMLDYTVWRDSFGSNVASLADGNRDGRVNIADYVVWRNNLGASISDSLAGSQSQAVPEPSGVLLLATAAWGAGWLMRRRAA